MTQNTEYESKHQVIKSHGDKHHLNDHEHSHNHESEIFEGNIFIFHSFDIGDDIDLEKIKNANILIRRPVTLSKYFKNYHIPLAVELPHPHSSPRCVGVKLHNFGVVTLRYQIPFSTTLEQLRANINELDSFYHEQSVADAGVLFKKIKNYINKPRFFHLHTSYMLIQVTMNPVPRSAQEDVIQFKEQHGNVIASLLRFETETLSEYQKDEIVDSAFGYYQGDLIIIDTDAAFIYDDEYEDKLDIFEFANIQHLELQYFDRALDKKLNAVYEGKVKQLPWKAYLPMIGAAFNEPVSELDQLKVDISVITDRLENSVTLTGDVYYSELYSKIAEKLDLKNWRESLHNKLSIIHDISMVHQNRVEASRNDFLSVIVIILIFIELLVALVK